ncbi:hypothetical protein ACN4EE_20910, partial [Geminocystis sp. CENA526]
MTQILSLSANNTQVKVGDTLEVSVSHSNDGTATAILTARLFFNGDKLAFVSSTVVTGQPLGTPVPVADSNNTDGIDETNFVIQYTNGGFSPFPAQETVIFKVTFTVLETFDNTQMVVNGTGRVNTVLEQQTLPITLEINQPPTSVNITNSIELAENTVIGEGIKVGDIAVTDDGLGTNVLSLTGADASSFAIRGMELFYVGASPDFETKNQYQVTVNVDDDTVGNTPDATTDFTLNITDVNEAPTAVTLTNTITELAENSVIGEGIKVGDIAVTDDALGTNVLSLTGTDASSFEIRGTELFYVGASPDFETKNQYQVTVNVDDGTVGDTPDATFNFTLAITDVNEAPTAVNIT